MIADPLTLLQCCPSQVDGAAAVVLTKRRPTGEHAVRVLGSVVQSGLREAPGDDILDAEITARAARLAYAQAGVDPADVGVVELHDAFTIMAVLSLESAGFAQPGAGPRLGAENRIGIDGDLPLSTMGGLKARGHPVGATGANLTLRVAKDMVRHDLELGIVTMCIGGGQALAALFRRI